MPVTANAKSQLIMAKVTNDVMRRLEEITRLHAKIGPVLDSLLASSRLAAADIDKLTNGSSADFVDGLEEPQAVLHQAFNAMSVMDSYLVAMGLENVCDDDVSLSNKLTLNGSCHELLEKSNESFDDYPSPLTAAEELKARSSLVEG